MTAAQLAAALRLLAEAVRRAENATQDDYALAPPPPADKEQQ
ncbi:hypothetical protein [Streptomyces sp. B15]|nr:hypothetical protein [Streptomyces sp. B15]